MIISDKTHTLHVIKQKNGIALCEITHDDAEPQPAKRFYVVRVSLDERQVSDAIPADAPSSGSWFAKFSAAGVDYVANPRSQATARRWFNRLAEQVNT